MSDTPDALHYRLTRDEWLSNCKQLKYAELTILYYLRTLDPFSDRTLDLKVIDVAQVTGLSKGTVSKSLRSLKDKGFIDLELVSVRVRLKKISCGKQVSCRKPEFPVGNLSCPQETSESCRKPEFPVGNNRHSEPIHSKVSRSPHTIHTDQTDQTLSHSPPTTPERELLEFAIRSLGNTEGVRNPRAYALKVLERDRQHWEETYSQWQQRSAVTYIPPPSPEQKDFDERESLIGLLKLKHQQGQPISLALKQKATQLGINLDAID